VAARGSRGSELVGEPNLFEVLLDYPVLRLVTTVTACVGWTTPNSIVYQTSLAF
jgi:hypothetical protein